MDRDEVLSTLRPLEPELKRLGFTKLYLFGSVARADPQPRDVDLLYEAAAGQRPGFRELTAAWDRLENALGKPVDLVRRDRLYELLRPRIEAEMVEVY